MDPLERAILEGGIPKDDGFGPERRATGHDPESPSSEPNTDDELGSAIFHSSAEDVGPVDKDLAALQEAEAESMRATSSSRRGGPSTHTGPKGVINDKKVQERLDRAKGRAAVSAANQKLQGMALNANTWDEEERLRKLEAKEKEGRGPSMHDVAAQQASIEELAARERRREQRMEELKAQMMSARGQGAKIVRGPNTWFGHLREVDARGYADAIDHTEEGTYVVVHIYSKLIMQCAMLSSALTSIARQYPQVKFLQVRAVSIGFGIAAHDRDEEDDDEGSGAQLREIEMEEDAADVVPTILVYRGGKLIHNLVRVDLDEDWRGGEERDIRDILSRRGILREDDDERLMLDSEGESDG